MWLTILLFLVGLGLIIKGGDFFVGASVEIARRTGLPRMVVGGTIVSLATTTPELTVSVMSSIEGSPGLAVGNAVGSVIVNLGLIVALVAIMRPIRINRREFGWPSSVMLIAGIVLFILTINLELGRWQGALLSAGGIAYIGVSYYRNRNWQGEAGNLDATPVQASTKDVDIHPPGKSGGWIALYFLAGLDGNWWEQFARKCGYHCRWCFRRSGNGGGTNDGSTGNFAS